MAKEVMSKTEEMLKKIIKQGMSADHFAELSPKSTEELRYDYTTKLVMAFFGNREVRTGTEARVLQKQAVEKLEEIIRRSDENLNIILRQGTVSIINPKPKGATTPWS